MKLRLNPDSAVPLYHQIAEAIQFRIAVGELRTGVTLPALRQAAGDWGVNLHTVGRAYRELGERGLVETAGRLGTRVVGSGAADMKGNEAERRVQDFLSRVVREASETHGLLVSDLARLLRNWPGEARQKAPVVHFVECSVSQCLEHAEEIEARWNVRALPWVLSHEGEPPPGPIVATYFHYHEIRRRWPLRRGDIHFVAIQPDRDLRKHLPARPDGSAIRELTLCEYDEPKAVNAVSELALILPKDTFRMEPCVVTRAGERLRRHDDGIPLIFPPRVWADLTDEERADPRAIHLRFYIDPAELEALGENLGWSAFTSVRAA